ncbi:MAG: hypothetical protein RL711_1232, partial [Bacteroidota bacterium]
NRPLGKIWDKYSDSKLILFSSKIAYSPQYTSEPRKINFFLSIYFRLQKKYKVQSTEYRVQGTGYRVLSTRYKVQSTRYRVLSTRYKVQSTRYKVQGTGYRVLSTKYKVTKALS